MGAEARDKCGMVVAEKRLCRIFGLDSGCGL
jgi:hypothetical protein